jgi:hypothetical protein
MPNGGTVRFITGGTMRRLHNECGEMRDEFMERFLTPTVWTSKGGNKCSQQIKENLTTSYK